MTLEQFAKKAGVELVECSKEWGGTIGYKTKDRPHTTVCGFKTATSAYKSWLSGTFGEQASKAVLKLLAPSKRKQS